MHRTPAYAAATFAAILALPALPACQADNPPPPACNMEVLAHLTPLPPSDDPFAYQYSEVAARDGIAYLGASGGAGVQVLDVSAGEKIAALDAGLAQNINSVAAAGPLLAFAPGNQGIVVYDISNPRGPARRAQRRDPVSYCHTVFIHGDMVYCSTSSSSEPHLAFYRVVTPADPAAPLEIEAAGSYSAPVTPEEEQAGADILVHDVFVHVREGRTLAYLAYWERGMQIVDVTDPQSPRLVGATAPTPTRWTHSVWVEGGFAYLGEESYKGVVRVLDVADPAAPVEVGQLRSAEGDAISAHNVQVASGVVYASWYQDGLRAFAARGAAAPAEVGYFHTWNGADNRQNPGPSDARFAGNWDVFIDGDRIYASDMQTGLWVLRHDQRAAACPPDRPRGTSAFAKTGRPPFGWNGSQPRRVRPARTVPLLALLTSVDPYFPLTDEIARGLRPRIEVRGATMVGATEVLPGPGPDGRTIPYRLVTALAQLPPQIRSEGLSLSLVLDDEGVERRLQRPLEALPVAMPNRDVEPNEDPWISGLLQPDPAGRATCDGTLDESDRRDVYALEPRPGAQAMRLRLVTGGAAGEPPQPTALLVVSRSIATEQGFGDPARQAIAEGWQQEVMVPTGETATLYLSVEALTTPGDGATLPYTVEISAP